MVYFFYTEPGPSEPEPQLLWICPSFPSVTILQWTDDSLLTCRLSDTCSWASTTCICSLPHPESNKHMKPVVDLAGPGSEVAWLTFVWPWISVGFIGDCSESLPVGDSSSNTSQSQDEAELFSDTFRARTLDLFPTTPSINLNVETPKDKLIHDWWVREERVRAEPSNRETVSDQIIDRWLDRTDRSCLTVGLQEMICPRCVKQTVWGGLDFQTSFTALLNPLYLLEQTLPTSIGPWLTGRLLFFSKDPLEI